MTYPLLSRIEQPADIRHLSMTELKQLAAYVATLPGDLKTVPQAKFR